MQISWPVPWTWSLLAEIPYKKLWLKYIGTNDIEHCRGVIIKYCVLLSNSVENVHKNEIYSDKIFFMDVVVYEFMNL